ncbi:hypothetical protein [Polynucleobacter sp. 78F-HAINBA]|nr:hypothetical protein [Polynucleobacter sp. 78F-HAINBA]
MWMPSHAHMQVDADISIDAKQVVVCHRIDLGNKFHRSGVG